MIQDEISALKSKRLEIKEFQRKGELRFEIKDWTVAAGMKDEFKLAEIFNTRNAFYLFNEKIAFSLIKLLRSEINSIKFLFCLPL